MDWNEIKNKLYYTDDDYIRGVISFHLQDRAWKSIYKYISQDSLFNINNKNVTFNDLNIGKYVKNEIITITFNELPLLRWYLNNEYLLEMDIDARFVNSKYIHYHICRFFRNMSCLLNKKFILWMI